LLSGYASAGFAGAQARLDAGERGGRRANQTAPPSASSENESLQRMFDTATSGAEITIPPGQYNVSKGVLISRKSHLKVLAYGATINYTGQDPDARVLEIQNSQFVSVEGLTLTSANPQTGTAVTFRSSSGSATRFDEVVETEIRNFKTGIQMGIEGEGEVSENEVRSTEIMDCQYGIVQEDPKTETIRYAHVYVTGSIPNAVYVDMRQASAIFDTLVTGGSGPNTVHIKIGERFRNAVFIAPHLEIKNSDSIGLQYRATSAQLLFEGGLMSQFGPANRVVLIDFTPESGSRTGGYVTFIGTILSKINGGVAEMVVPTSPGLTVERRGVVLNSIAVSSSK